MPIPQSRLLALLDICAELERNSRQLRSAAQLQLADAIDEYHNEPDIAVRASNAIARLTAIAEILSEPILSYESLETLARERVHFAAHAQRNNTERDRRKRQRQSLAPAAYN